MQLLKVWKLLCKVKVIPQQAKVAQGVPGRLRPRIFVTFGTTRVVGRQPYAPAAFTRGEIPLTHFQRLSRLYGTWFRRGGDHGKNPVTPPGIDPGTVRVVAQCLNNYAIPGPGNCFVHDPKCTSLRSNCQSQADRLSATGNVVTSRFSALRSS
jgi:hypothetical protein